MEKTKIVLEKTHYISILISADAKPSEEFAAQELKNFIFQSTAINLPIQNKCAKGQKQFVIGDFDATSLSLKKELAQAKEDSFLIRTIENSTYIVGQNERAVVFGVYEILENYFGVRFVTPDYTYIPKHKGINKIIKDQIAQPCFEMRNFLNGYCYEQNPLFNLRMRTVHEFVEMPQEYGGNCGMYKGVGTVHNTLINFVDPALSKKHPEMFYMKDGGVREICFTNGINDDGTIDESMEISAVKVALQSLIEHVKKFKTNDHYIMFGQMDISDRCHCAKCELTYKKYNGGGVMLRFANVLAREIQKWSDENNDKKSINVIAFAYIHSENAPVKVDKECYIVPVDESVVAEKNVIVRLAFMFANNYYALTDFKQVVRQDKPDCYLAMLREWPKVANRFFVWTYEANYMGFFIYYPVLHTWKTNLDYFEKIGVKYVLMQGAHTEENSWQSNLNGYIGSKILWDKEIDIEARKEEFLKLYFGKDAHSFVKEFIEKLDKKYEKIMQEKELYLHCFELESIHSSNQSLDFQLELLDLIDQAQRKVEKSKASQKMKSFYIKNLLQTKITPLFAILLNGKEYFPTDEKQRIFYAKVLFEISNTLGVKNLQEGCESYNQFRKKYLEEK